VLYAVGYAAYQAADKAAYQAVDKDVGSNPFGIAALGVGVIVLIILLITFRRH
jgi:hypothetical protein